MAAKRDVAISELIDELDYELRNTAESQYDDETELYEYYCMSEEFIYSLLVNEESNLIDKTKGTVPLATDTEAYDLSSDGTADYSDFWTPYRVWIAGYDPLELKGADEYFEHLDSDGAVMTGIPSVYYLEGSNPDIVLLDAPDSSFNATNLNLWYYPNWGKPADDTVNIPFRNFFNSEIRQMIMIKAKNRNMKPAMVEAAWMELYHDRALMLADQNRETGIQLVAARG